MAVDGYDGILDGTVYNTSQFIHLVPYLLAVKDSFLKHIDSCLLEVNKRFEELIELLITELASSEDLVFVDVIC